MDVLRVRVLALVGPPAAAASIPDAAVPDHILDAAGFRQGLCQLVSAHPVRRIIGDVQRSDDAGAAVLDPGIVITGPGCMGCISDPAITYPVSRGSHRIEVVPQCHEALG